MTTALEAFNARVAGFELSERDERFFEAVRGFVEKRPDIPVTVHIDMMMQAAMYRLMQSGEGVTFAVLMHATEMAKLWGLGEDQCAKAYAAGARRATREAIYGRFQ